MGLKNKTAEAVQKATKIKIDNKMTILRNKYKTRIDQQIIEIQNLYKQQNLTRDTVIDKLRRSNDFGTIFESFDDNKNKRFTFKSFYEQVINLDKKQEYQNIKDEAYALKEGIEEQNLIKEITNAMSLILEIRKDFLGLANAEETITIIYEIKEAPEGQELQSVTIPMSLFFKEAIGVLTTTTMSTKKTGFRDSRQISFSIEGRDKLIQFLDDYAKKNTSAVNTYSKTEYEAIKKRRIKTEAQSQSGETGYIAEGLMRRALLGQSQSRYGRNTGSYAQRPDIFGINKDLVIISSAKSLLEGDPTLVAVQTVIDDLYKIQNVFNANIDNINAYNQLKDKIFRISKSEEDLAKKAATVLRKMIKT